MIIFRNCSSTVTKKGGRIPPTLLGEAPKRLYPLCLRSPLLFFAQPSAIHHREFVKFRSQLNRSVPPPPGDREQEHRESGDKAEAIRNSRVHLRLIIRRTIRHSSLSVAS